jgi:Family of unknown function (DUF6644)
MADSVSTLCQAFETSSLGKQLFASTWMWPAIESLHVIGMVVLVGSITVFDLRLLGLAMRSVPISLAGHRLLRSTWGAFTLMVLTGTLLFTPLAERKYCFNTPFRIKLLLIVLAGINMSVFHFTVQRSKSNWDEGPTPVSAKVAGTVSVLLWASVVIAGRFIAFA